MIVARTMASALAVVVVGISAVAAAEPGKSEKEPDIVSYYPPPSLWCTAVAISPPSRAAISS